jgi:hypothetical protein
LAGFRLAENREQRTENCLKIRDLGLSIWKLEGRDKDRQIAALAMLVIFAIGKLRRR